MAPTDRTPGSRADAPRSGESDDASDASGDRARVSAIRGGDLEAFEFLFRAHYATLVAFAETFVDSRDVAEDLVEDLFVRLWERRTDWHVEGQLTAYLRKAVRNAALNHLDRGRRVVRLHERAAAAGAAPGIGARPRPPDRRLDEAALEKAVAIALENLPERAREAFVLHRFHGKRQAEIAATMGISRRTVENHIARAVRLLREALAPWK
jgi:RNA polymerase sigma-70 factor (ECF subfamily)